ncbi:MULTISPECIES: S49 family peptidase [unclassified Comamonas]|uniref:S49 family peptidase n=1 Tax=unclassified Comamonas TaxID=2638500 RepID=UPI001FA70ED5|nr:MULTISPECIES: S49 family peptidase [unclassified Comamonas]UNV89525.1 S49 family peptidase [Comamonas sp. 7D-2evo1]UNV97176.1 S49 family peptidase [Comamonas sp. 7D-2]UNV99170.1 S49 family peptidase [Comamonas sp. 7D-2evo2]
MNRQMSRPYPHLADRLFNTPLLLHPQKLDAIIAGLGQRLLGTDGLQIDAAAISPRAALPAEMFTTRKGERTERGYRVNEGVAVISAMGGLVHRTRLEADSSLLIGYNDLAADMEDALAQPEVHAIALVLDSPGGEVSGAFELADRIYAARGRKPIVAVADGMAASAAYLAASAADEVVLTTTSYVGSIGVVMRHVDYSRALANEGINVSHIFAGEHKVDGNPYQPLPTSVREHLQADIEGLYQMFVQAVAKHRGMEEQAVRDTRAAVYRGVAGVAARLADRIGTADAVIADLSARRARSYPAGAGMSFQPQGASMGDPQTIQPAAAAPAEPSTATVAAPAAASAAAPTGPVAAASAAAPQGLEQARAEGAQAERARVSAILGHANAAANPTLAQTCIAGGLTAEQAQGVLDAAPAAAVAALAPAASNQFAQAMAALGNPNVSGVEAASPDGSAQAATQAAAGWGKAFGTAP